MSLNGLNRIRSIGPWLIFSMAIAAAAPESAMASSQWSDGFESYPVGRFPSSNWSNSGNSQVTVTNTTSESGSNSLYLYGLIGQDWAALAHRQFSYAPSLMFDFSVKNGSEPLHGIHQEYGIVELNTGPSWTTPGRGLIGFGEDGLIHGPALPGGGELSGPVLGQFTAGTWYDVQIAYRAVNPSTISLSYWVNGRFDGTLSVASAPYEGNLSYLGLVSGAGSAWFDNVSVGAAPVPEPASLVLMCLGGAGLLMRRLCSPVASAAVRFCA